MEWKLLQDILTESGKQLPAVALLGIICVVLWKSWMAERKENKRLNQEMKTFLMSLLRQDDDSSEP